MVPTFREAPNLRALATRVSAAMTVGGWAWELVLVDDDSGDGSVEIANELAERLPLRMEVRRGVPRDLSRAVLHGIRLARFDRIVVMDADLSHPPERIPDLLNALDASADIVVGSRYAPGGEIDQDWGAWRHLNSRLATLLARSLVNCSDPMAGFFAVDRNKLPNPDRLHPIGYKIALELMVRGRLRIAEVPIAFSDRLRGVSKLNWRQQVNYLRHVHRLYLFRYGGMARLASFLCVGASGFLIDVAFYLGLQSFGLEHRLARFLSFWPAVTWNWRLNRGLTFAERPWRPQGRQWAQFVGSSLLGLSANVGSYTMLTSFVAFFGQNRLLALVCGVAVGSIANYVVANGYVYGRRSARAVDGPQ
ncbi:MAG: glycosyltransferase family 2 protein [Gammaproteobacteria bacterium]|nr:glycosyltransferase family 2 protein [Gammaproteobacteria bacterium]